MSRLINTALQPIWSGKGTSDASAVFIPLTGPINTAHVDEALFSYYVESSTGGTTIRRAYNMSDDGETWSSTVTAIGAFSIDTGWVYDTATATAISTDQRNFVRFGLEVKNKTGAALHRAMARARIELFPTNGQTLVAGPKQVWSDGSTTPIFHPMTRPVPLSAIAQIRASVEMAADSGDAEIQAAYQLGDDARNWEETSGVWDYTTFETAQDGNGLHYGTGFTDFTTTGSQFIRFGVVCGNGAAGKTENCLASLRVDIRGNS